MRTLATALGRLFFSLPALLLRTLLLWWASRRRLVVEVSLAGGVVEQVGARGRRTAGGRRSLLLSDWLESLELVGRDVSVAALKVRLGALEAGWAQLEELRGAVSRLRTRGKKTFVYLDRAGHKEFFLASAFDHITVAPQATLDLVGLRAEVTFYKRGLDRIGVTGHFLAAGEYKSFGEPYLREEMSEAFRESLDLVLRGLHSCFLSTVAAARGLDQGRLEELMDGGPLTVSEGLEAGLVDEVLYPDRWKKELRKLLGDRTGDDEAAPAPRFAFREVQPRSLVFKGFRSFLRPWRLLRKLERLGMPAPRIAVVVASGPIIPWDEAEIAPGRIGARPLASVLRRVARDKRISAVVLRVDSPGGSGMVSDLLWRELRRLKDKKPLVVSMGSTAASGGYYLAMAGDRVLANPTTITGSIGVVAGKFDVSGLLDKLGLKQEVLSYGRNTGIYSPTTGLTDAERERLQSFVGEFYEVFVQKAADCRGLGRDELETHARGRIWTGTQAVERGLVDKTGGLDAALAEAAQLARLGVNWETCWVESPRPGLVARLQSLVPVFGSGLGIVEHAREELVGSRPDLVQARLPFDLRFL